MKASFTYSPVFLEAGQAVRFTDTSVGSPTSWQWDFGDGSTSQLQNPNHTYNVISLYRVTLTVSNGSGTKTVRRSVKVSASSSFSASFSYSPAFPPAGQGVHFTDTSTGTPASWQWDFGDGVTSRSQHPSHTYATEGFYRVSLTVGNETETKVINRAIKIASASVLSAAFTYSPSSPIEGQVVQFGDSSVGNPSSWQWNFGDGSASTSQNPGHAYTTAGSYNVTLTVANGSDSNTVSRTVTVTPSSALSAAFIYSPSSPVAGQTVQFTDTSTGTPTSWQWNFGDGSTSTSRNPSHAYATAGSRTVTLTVNNGSGSNSTSRTVTVEAALTAAFTYSPSSPVAGHGVQFTDTSVGAPTSWHWNFGDGTTSSTQNPYHSFMSSGSFYVTLTVSNTSREDNVVQPIVVAPVSTIVASFTYNPALPAPGQVVQFTDSSTGTPTSWQWNFGDGTTSTAQNPNHAFMTSGSYSVTLIAGNASGSTSTSRTISVTTVDVIPDDRLYDWTHTGVPGGIPNRTTIYTTLTSSATTAEINSAIQSCPPDQVVYLSAGTYNLGQLTFGSKTGVTLRGAGAGRTILNISSRIINSGATYYESAGIAVSSGYTKGSTAIVLASTPSSNFSAGRILAMSEDASPDKWGAGIGTYYREGMSPGSSLYNLNQYRIFRHMNRIVSVNGNTINLAVPIPLDFSGGLDVEAYPPGSSVLTSLCGIENLTIDARNSVDTPIWFHSADRCWVQNVELKNVPGSDIGMIRFWQCFQCEIRRCYIHDATGYPNQNDGFATSFNYGSSNCLIVDCIVDRVADLCESNGAAGCAYLYNYTRDTLRAGIYSRGMTVNHGPHGLMLLAEGNLLSTITSDGYHGSTSHVVAFRNHINGLNSQYSLSQRKLVNLCRGSYYHTLVGNILGDSSWTPSHYEFPYSGGSSIQAIYFIGFPAADTISVPIPSGAIPFANYSKYYQGILDTEARYPDPDVASTLLRHGNFDYYHNAAVWDNDIASHTIPNSLVYGSKPDFFGSLQWPPIGPDVSGFVSPIPAKARWDAYVISGNLSDLFRDF